MSAISIRIPDSLHKQIRELAKRQNVSINQLVTLAVAEKVSALETEDYLKSRADRASREAFVAALEKVPNAEPDPDDRVD